MGVFPTTLYCVRIKEIIIAKGDSNMKEKNFCQSCAMPLSNQGIEMNGTEKDGSKSEKYCKYCYLNGAFTTPNCTFEEMLAIGKKGIKEGPGNPFMKYFILLSYPFLLKKVERWQVK